MIREYFEDHIKYFPDRWRWELKNSNEQNELYLRTRARRSKDFSGRNYDLLPNFLSIEQDANQFEFKNVEWTDFFGLVWKGKKGINAYVGAPDYKGSLYYCHHDEEYDEREVCISSEYDAYDNQPPIDIYTRIKRRGINHWIDTANVVDISYKYIVNNHLFKDTHIDLMYEEKEYITVYSDYQELIDGLIKHGKKDLVNKIFLSMNEHFNKLRDSDDENEREFYPGKTAEEMFLGRIE